MGFLHNVISLFGGRREAENVEVEIPRPPPANDVKGITVGRVIEDGWIRVTLTAVEDDHVSFVVDKIKNDRWAAFLNESEEYIAEKHEPGWYSNPPVVYEVPEERLNNRGPQVLLWYWPEKDEFCLEWDM